MSGSTWAAARAGTNAATRATSASSTAAPPMTSGSYRSIPKSICSSTAPARRAATKVSGTPMAMPTGGQHQRLAHDHLDHGRYVRRQAPCARRSPPCAAPPRTPSCRTGRWPRGSPQSAKQRGEPGEHRLPGQRLFDLLGLRPDVEQRQRRVELALWRCGPPAPAPWRRRRCARRHWPAPECPAGTERIPWGG